MCVANEKHIFNNNFHFIILGNPLIVPLTWVSVLCFLLFFSNKISSKFPNLNSIFALSILNGLLGVFIDLVIDPLAVRLGLWTYLNQPFRVLNVPLWNFIGWFLGIFVFFLGYYFFEKFEFKKRILFTYAYIFSILTIRFLAYYIL